MTTYDAPDLPAKFATSKKAKTGSYPNAGPRIGPCWRAMWAVLTDAPGPVWLEHLARIGAAAGACSPETAKMLADRFRQAGILISEKEVIRSRWQLIYIRADQAEKIENAYVSPEWLAEWCARTKNPRLEGIEFP